MTLTAAIDALAGSMVVGVPTDTVYGLAVDPHNQAAVESLFAIKGRPVGSPLVVLVASMQAAEQLVDIPPAVRSMLDLSWPGALTAVLRTSVSFSKGVGDPEAGTVAFRVPDHPELHELLMAWGPLAVTSANRTGSAPTLSADEAVAVFGEEVAVYVEGVCRGGEPSSVVDFTGTSPVVLRVGPVVIAGS